MLLVCKNVLFGKMSLFNAKADIDANDIVICKDGEASVSATHGFTINSFHQTIA